MTTTAAATPATVTEPQLHMLLSLPAYVSVRSSVANRLVRKVLEGWR